MASPPYRSPATSPPNPSHTALPNPRKRPLPSIITNNSYANKRMASSFSATSSSHPLRQTSFPPEETRDGERSPSIDTVRTAGTGAPSVTTSVVGKKRGRKKKDDRDVVSVRSAGKASGVGDGVSASGRTGNPEDEPEVEEEDDFGGAADDIVDNSSKVDEAHEKRRMNVLLDAFSQDQNERYDVYRRVKLKKETVRKIVNQTLSQSVPPQVITAINGFTKVYLGTLIEQARQVQAQQVALAEQSLPTPPVGPSPPDSASAMATSANGNRVEQASNSVWATDWTKEGPLKTKDGYMGPILPDHLREAYRRYRASGEGGGSGVEGRSVGLGVTGAGSARLRGRRLFK